jgi:hypothetical protein
VRSCFFLMLFVFAPCAGNVFAFAADPQPPANDPQITIKEIDLPARPAICRDYAKTLSEAYVSAVQDIYKQAISLPARAIDSPLVLFNDPVPPEADLAIVPNWTLCLPLVETPDGAPANPYVMKQVGPLAAIEVNCSTEPSVAKACKDQTIEFLKKSNYSLLGTPVLEKPDDPSVRLVPIKKPTS